MYGSGKEDGMKEDISKSLVRKMSVKNRITLMVILISVFPILVISIFSYAKAYISVPVSYTHLTLPTKA